MVSGRSFRLVTRTKNPADNAAFEEANATFRIDRWVLDSFLVEFRDGHANGEPRNLTGDSRVSRYNPVFFLRDDPQRLGWNPLIDGKQKAYSMRLDGTDRREIFQESGNNFTYGYSRSPDGKRIAYLVKYQLYLANGDGSGATWIQTGQPFNAGYEWLRIAGHSCLWPDVATTRTSISSTATAPDAASSLT